jgi:hypothetical protein
VALHGDILHGMLLSSIKNYGKLHAEIHVRHYVKCDISCAEFHENPTKKIQTLIIGNGVTDGLRRRVERTERRCLLKRRPLLLREEYVTYTLLTLATLAIAVLNISCSRIHLPSILVLSFVCDTLVMNALHCRKPVASEPCATYGGMILFSLPTVRKHVV